MAPADLTVTAWKGTSGIELQLIANEFEKQTDALVALTSAVAAKID